MPTDRVCLPVNEWPVIDRQLWVEGLREHGLFDGSSVAAHWSALSRKKIAQGYGRWLQWLQATGQCDAEAPPGQRVTPSRVAAYIRHLREMVAPHTLVSRLQDLLDALRLLAPQDDLTWLATVWGTLRMQAVPTRQKRLRLRPADNLAALGFRMMLAYRPVRLKNFAAMCLGQHVVALGGHTWMVFAATETKSRRPYEAVFPEALEGRLQRYLHSHRLVLLAGERGDVAGITNALWISENATHLEAGALSKRIAMHTLNAFGRSIPPHWFRDAAATSIAIDDPVHVRDAHLVLGHAGLATTERHYILAQSLQASRRHQATLAQLIQTKDGSASSTERS